MLKLKSFFSSFLALGLCLGITGVTGSARADGPGESAPVVSRGTSLEKAEGTTLAKATGHFARARSFLIAAIQEFDAGTRIASPDAILNSSEWRKSLINRTEELEHILDPQPRITRGGVRYSADSRLISETKK